MVAQEDLTKPLRIATQVPAPDDNVRYTDKPASGGSGTIEIRACSELTEHAAPVNHFSTDDKLKCVQGFQGEPLVFAIGNNNVCCPFTSLCAGSSGTPRDCADLMWKIFRDSTALPTSLVLLRAGPCTTSRRRRRTALSPSTFRSLQMQTATKA